MPVVALPIVGLPIVALAVVGLAVVATPILSGVTLTAVTAAILTIVTLTAVTAASLSVVTAVAAVSRVASSAFGAAGVATAGFTLLARWLPVGLCRRGGSTRCVVGLGVVAAATTCHLALAVRRGAGGCLCAGIGTLALVRGRSGGAGRRI